MAKSDDIGKLPLGLSTLGIGRPVSSRTPTDVSGRVVAAGGVLAWRLSLPRCQ